jgi:hypothetical protein
MTFDLEAIPLGLGFISLQEGIGGDQTLGRVTERQGGTAEMTGGHHLLLGEMMMTFFLVHLADIRVVTQGKTHLSTTQILKHNLNHKGLAGSQEQSMV